MTRVAEMARDRVSGRRALSGGGRAVLLSAVVLAFLTVAARGPAALAAQTGPTDSPDGIQEAWTMVEDWLVERMEEEGVVGGSLYLVRAGEVVERLHHGLADLESGRPVDENTIYHWASNTKTLTAVSLMQLRDRGEVSLDDPIVSYLPELRAVHNPYGPMEAITLRHLLSHSSGFRSSTWPWGGGEEWHPHEPSRWEQLVAMMPYTRIHFPPGSRYRYSNPGIIFVGEVIEQLSGDDIEVYVDKNVLSPLGMHRTYFDATPYHLLEHRSNNYVVEGGEPVAQGKDFDTGITASNGGLNAPVPDMVRWLSFLLGFAPNEAGEGVLARSSLEEMWEPVVEAPDEPGGPTWLGLSFFVLERDGRRYVGHTGSQKAFRSFFYIDPATGAGVIGAFNTVGSGDGTGPDTDQLRVDLRERLLAEVLPLFAEE